MTDPRDYGRPTAPLRRFEEAAYWYHAMKSKAWTPEFDYHLRAFAQAFSSAADALERSWKIAPKPIRHPEMEKWWKDRRVQDEFDSRAKWVSDLRSREFHTTKSELPPAKRTAAGWRDPGTGGFIAFMHHQIPGDEQTVEWYTTSAFLGFAKILAEFGTKFEVWAPDDVTQAKSFPESLKHKNRPKGKFLGELTIGPGPYESFGPGVEAARRAIDAEEE